MTSGDFEQSEDHPRGCGEHQPESPKRRKQRGSSPRMRGAPGHQHVRQPRQRIIPADAGSTRTHRSGLCRKRDHRRGCGEHICTGDGALPPEGSSPRMRGAQSLRLLGLIQLGIIPADAGSTAAIRQRRPWNPDHPRGCGEHQTICDWNPSGRGSSPRMRGALAFVAFRPLHTGIIPADAGSTSWTGFPRATSGDHPRGCGEHTPTSGTPQDPAGSSPRMRGALIDQKDLSRAARIIPADAGSTTPPVPCSC